jgi:hypothetical protein
LIANFVNAELDDVVNGIADVYTNVYTLTIDRTTAEGIPTGVVQLGASITYNGDSVTRTLEWSSSDTAIATVSTAGLVTLLSLGNCTITAQLEDNSLVVDTCVITVTNTPAVNSDVTITPDKNYILEGSLRVYTVYLYENDVVQGDTFTITCNPNSVPTSSYSFLQTDGNHFTVSNILRDVESYLTITCTAGANVKTIDIYLRGAWQYDNA